METLQKTSFPIYPARFPFARGIVLWALLATSLSALLVQASGADGIFWDYFTRMIEGSWGTGVCPTGKVITGFSVNTSDYGTPICADAPGWDGAPIWTIAAFNSATCPAGWSPANGTSGTPDLRGEFIRGLDSGRGIDSGRVLGTWQDASKVPGAGGNPTPMYIQGNNYAYATHPTTTVPMTTHNLEQISSTYFTSWNWLPWFSAYETTSNGTAVFWKVRPRNIALLYCMKTSNIVPTPAVTWWNTNAATPADGNVVQLTSGNVGIGTSSPTQKLDVEWNVRINGTANVSNANIGQVDTNRICLSGNCKTAWPTPTPSYFNAPLVCGMSAWQQIPNSNGVTFCALTAFDVDYPAPLSEFQARVRRDAWGYWEYYIPASCSDVNAIISCMKLQ